MHHYGVDGIDINESYLRAVRLKNPSGNYTRAGMMDFDLGGIYDVVTCLFSAIGIVSTFEVTPWAAHHGAQSRRQASAAR